MNRGSKHLVPIAPRPSSAVSLDPRDYCYPSEQSFVWGVPQADHLQPQQAGMMQHHVGAYVMPHQGMYGSYHATGSWGQPGLSWSQPHMLPSPGHIPVKLPAQPPPVTQGILPEKASGASLPSNVLSSQGDETQVVPKLEGVDELLHMPLDEDCLQKLLSGADLEDDLHAAACKPMELGPSGECSRERGDASGDSTCTGDAKAAKAGARGQGQQPEEGDSVSGAELLTAVDPKLSISDTSVLKTMGSFGEDLDYLASLHDLDTGSSQDLLAPLAGSVAADSIRADVLARTKSEAALPTGASARNPLACLGRDTALHAIAEYLSSDCLRSALGDCCDKAAEAVRAVQAAAAASATAAGVEAELPNNAVPKRKRSAQPVRSASQKSLKTEA